MKKLVVVVVVAMFMFVCGGSFLVKAQSSAEAAKAQPEVKAIIINDTIVTDTINQDESVQVKADSVIIDTTSANLPAELNKE